MQYMFLFAADAAHVVHGKRVRDAECYRRGPSIWESVNTAPREISFGVVMTGGWEGWAKQLHATILYREVCLGYEHDHWSNSSGL